MLTINVYFQSPFKLEKNYFKFFSNTKKPGSPKPGFSLKTYLGRLLPYSCSNL